jgi:hypothetical protein
MRRTLYEMPRYAMLTERLRHTALMLNLQLTELGIEVEDEVDIPDTDGRRRR